MYYSTFAYIRLTYMFNKVTYLLTYLLIKYTETQLTVRRNIYLFTNDKGRLAPLTCHIVYQTLKSLDNSINTKVRKYDIKITRPTK